MQATKATKAAKPVKPIDRIDGCWAAARRLLGAPGAKDDEAYAAWHATDVLVERLGGGGGGRGLRLRRRPRRALPTAKDQILMAKKLPGDELPAVVAFRAFAAQKLGIAVDQVQGGPTSEAHAALFKEQRVGKLWAFVMWRPETKKAPKVEVRGWASPDGKVITLEQNLGLLFAEAGAWGGGL